VRGLGGAAPIRFRDGDWIGKEGFPIQFSMANRSRAAPPKTLITPALFSQPPPRPPGEEGEVSPEKPSLRELGKPHHLGVRTLGHAQLGRGPRSRFLGGEGTQHDGADGVAVLFLRQQKAVPA
jgi:hypothetical protein